MANYCGIICSQEKNEQTEQFLSFPDLWNLTCSLLEEINTVEDIFQRQTLKVVERERKVLEAKSLLGSLVEMIANAKLKLDQIDNELSSCLFNFDVLALFIGLLENAAPEINPCTVDCSRFPIYEGLLQLISLVDSTQEIMECIFAKYEGYIQAYHQNHSITSILDCHIKILENIAFHLNSMNEMQKDIEQKLNSQMKNFYSLNVSSCNKM